MGAFLKIAAQLFARGGAAGAAMKRGAVNVGSQVVKRGGAAANQAATYAAQAAKRAANYASRAINTGASAAKRYVPPAYRRASQAATRYGRYVFPPVQTSPQAPSAATPVPPATPAFGPNSQMTNWQANQQAMQTQGAPVGVQGPPAPPQTPTQVQAGFDAAKKWGKDLLESVPVIGKFASKMIAGTAAFVGLFKAAQLYVGSLVESRRSLSMFSATITASMARLDIKKFGLDMQTAQNTSGSTARLTDAYADLLDELQPIRENTMTIVNTVASVGTKMLTTIVMIAKELPWLGGKMDEIIRGLEDEGPDLTPLAEFLRDTRESDWADDL